MKILNYFIFINLLLTFIIGIKLKKNKQYNCKYLNEYLDAQKKNRKKDEGHYEKYVTTRQELIYVPGNKPSGLPGAFVVSKEEAERMNPININFVEKGKKEKK
jgi:hypothetical protein